MQRGELEYAMGKAYLAVRTLAAGSGGLKDRLHDAWISSFHRIDLHLKQDTELLAKFDVINDRFVSQSPNSISDLDERALSELAGLIVDFYSSVCRALQDGDRVKARSA